MKVVLICVSPKGVSEIPRGAQNTTWELLNTLGSLPMYWFHCRKYYVQKRSGKCRVKPDHVDLVKECDCSESTEKTIDGL